MQRRSWKPVERGNSGKDTEQWAGALGGRLWEMKDTGPGSEVDVWPTVWAPRGKNKTGRIREEGATAASKQVSSFHFRVCMLPASTTASSGGCAFRRGVTIQETYENGADDGEKPIYPATFARVVFRRVLATTFRFKVIRMHVTNIVLLQHFSGIRGVAHIFKAFTCICTSLFQQNLFSSRMLVKEASDIVDSPVDHQPYLLRGVALGHLLQSVIGHGGLDPLPFPIAAACVHSRHWA